MPSSTNLEAEDTHIPEASIVPTIRVGLQAGRSSYLMQTWLRPTLRRARHPPICLQVFALRGGTVSPPLRGGMKVIDAIAQITRRRIPDRRLEASATGAASESLSAA